MRQETKFKLNKLIRARLSESILGVIIGARDVPGNPAGVYIGTIFAILLAFFSSLFSLLGNGYSFAYLLLLSYAFGFGFVYILRAVVDKCIEETTKEFETQIASNQLAKAEQTKSNYDTKRTIGTNVVACIELNKTAPNKFTKTDIDAEETKESSAQKEETVKSSKGTPSKKKDDDMNYPSDPRNPSHGSSIGSSSLFSSANMF